MGILEFKRPATVPPRHGAGSWGELVAWFSELVRRLDRGDLVGAVEAQAEIERHGFQITYRRRHRRGGGR